MEGKWLEIGSGIGSKLVQNWLKIGSKLAQNWLKIGSKLDQNWLKIGSEIVEKQRNGRLIYTVDFRVKSPDNKTKITINYRLK